MVADSVISPTKELIVLADHPQALLDQSTGESSIVPLVTAE